MSKFEALWRGAVDELPDDGLKPALLRMGVPARLSLLASRSGGLGEGMALDDATAALAADPELARADPARIRAAIRALGEREDPGRGVDGDFLVQVAQAAGRRFLGSGASEAEAREAVALLRNGDFFGDLEQSTGAILLAVPALARSLPATLTGAPGFLRRLFEAVFGDLADLVQDQLPDLARDLADGTIDHPPRILDRSLRELYGEASIEATVGAVRTLVRRDNRSIRLAILLYARLNGIPIEERHLDTLHDDVLNPDDPNLAPALEDAVDVLVQRHPGAGEALGVLRRFASERADGRGAGG